jgi:hypothetical protein
MAAGIEVELAILVDINPADAVASEMAALGGPELQSNIGEASGAKGQKREQEETKKTKAGTVAREIFVGC